MSELLPTSTSYGYFGVKKIYYLFKIPVLMKIRTLTHDKYKIYTPLGFKLIFKTKLPNRFYLANKENDIFDIKNLQEIEKIRNLKQNGKTIFFYLLDHLSCTGGVERRLEIQFKWLKEKNIQPVLVCEKQDYAPLKNYPTLYIVFHAPNAQKKLFLYSKLCGAHVIEFNMKCPRFLYSIDLIKLKKQAILGCMVHNKIQVHQTMLDKLDYRCSSYRTTRIKNINVIPNTVEFPKSCPNFNIQANKALYIGRIDKDKLQTVKNFIEICLRYDIDFEIAGSISNDKEVLSFFHTIPDSKIIGIINTRLFLLEKGSNYLFFCWSWPGTTRGCSR